MNPESQIPSNRAIDEMLIQHDVQNQKKQKTYQPWYVHM